MLVRALRLRSSATLMSGHRSLLYAVTPTLGSSSNRLPGLLGPAPFSSAPQQLPTQTRQTTENQVGVDFQNNAARKQGLNVVVPEDRSIFKDQDDTFVDKYFPSTLKPYAKLARLDRPVGTLLLMYPGWWSIALAAEHGQLPRLDLLAAFGLGAFIMRSAGCTINDLWDRDIDGKVARTKNRPLASGEISVNQLFGGLFVLTTLNEYSIVLGASSLALVATYPMAKRFFSWPQLVLGLTFNWGALLGWSAVHGELDFATVLPLYAGCVSWTLMYDTLYAHQDKEDDRKLGLQSSALTIGDENTRPVLAGFSALTVAGLITAGLTVDMGIPYYAGVMATAGHLGWQIYTADLNDRVNLTKRFVSNQWIGAMMFTSIVADKLY